MPPAETLHARTDELLDRIEAARTVTAECEHFGLLAQDLVTWAEDRREEALEAGRARLRELYAQVLYVVSPVARGEAANWRENTAARHVDGLDNDALVDGLRAITRVRVAVERLATTPKGR